VALSYPAGVVYILKHNKVERSLSREDLSLKSELNAVKVFEKVKLDFGARN